MPNGRRKCQDLTLCGIPPLRFRSGQALAHRTRKDGASGLTDPSFGSTIAFTSRWAVLDAHALL